MQKRGLRPWISQGLQTGVNTKYMHIYTHISIHVHTHTHIKTTRAQGGQERHEMKW